MLTEGEGRIPTAEMAQMKSSSRSLSAVKLKKTVARVCIAQICLLSLNSLPAFSLTNDVSANTAQLDQYEQSLYGYTKKQQALGSRLDSLEMTIFGAKQNGSNDSRINAISQAVGKSKSDLLLPPMAPKLDTNIAPAAPSHSGSNRYTAADHYTAAGQDDSYDSGNYGSSAPAPGTASSLDKTLAEPSVDVGESAADRSRSVLQRATSLYSQGHMAEAEQAFRQVLTIDYRNADAYYNLGVIAESRGDLQGALSNYQRAAGLKPGDSELADAVRAVQGKIADKVAQDGRAKAQQQQAQALARATQTKESLKQTAADAQVAFKAGDYNRAIAGLNTVAAQAPNDPDVQYALSQAYRGKGDLNSARLALGRALSLDPQNQLYKTAMNDLSNVPANGNAAYGNQPGNSGRQSGYGSGSQSAYGSRSGYGGGSQSGYTPPIADAYSASGNAPPPFSGDPSASSGVTPFTSAGESQLASTPGYHHGYANGGSPSFSMTSFGGLPLGLGLGGMGMGGGGYGNSGSTRLKRVAIGAGAGMAVGALIGMPSHHSGRSAMTGAVVGGMLGLITGGF